MQREGTHLLKRFQRPQSRGDIQDGLAEDMRKRMAYLIGAKLWDDWAEWHQGSAERSFRASAAVTQMIDNAH